MACFAAIDGLVDIMEELGDRKWISLVVNPDVTILITVAWSAILSQGRENGVGQSHDKLSKGE